MGGPTIDLLSNHIYQQMVQVVYFGRCMVKWAWMFLSGRWFRTKRGRSWESLWMWK